MAKHHDNRCYDLAEHFLLSAGSPVENTEGKRSKLAQHIQDAIEDWLGSNENRMSDRRLVMCSQGHRSSVPGDAISAGGGATHKCPECGLGVG
jgi:hypothetical protein